MSCIAGNLAPVERSLNFSVSLCGGLLAGLYHDEALRRGYHHLASANWPSKATLEDVSPFALGGRVR